MKELQHNVCTEVNSSFNLKNGLYFFFNLLSERWEGREEERKRNINVWEKHQLVASHVSPTENLAHNPGMCPDWELNPRLSVHRPALNPLSHTSQGKNGLYFYQLSFDSL